MVGMQTNEPMEVVDNFPFYWLVPESSARRIALTRKVIEDMLTEEKQLRHFTEQQRIAFMQNLPSFINY